MGVMGLNMLSKKATGFIRTFTLCYAKITAFCRDIGEMVHFERVVCGTITIVGRGLEPRNELDNLKIS
jgi:hypothetical protein